MKSLSDRAQKMSIHSLEELLGELRPTATDYFAVLFHLASSQATVEAYLSLYELLQRICEDHSSNRVFSNLFSRLSYVAHQAGLTSSELAQMQSLRRRCYRDVPSAEKLEKSFRIDLRLMAEFVHQVCQSAIPDNLIKLLPVAHIRQSSSNQSREYYRELRVRVKRCAADYIEVEKDETDGASFSLRLYYGESESPTFLASLRPYLKPDVTLNLLNARMVNPGVCDPDAVIFEPDYLIDVSVLAACFKEYGNDERNYILKRLQPHEDTEYTLLGQAASQFLDDAINNSNNPHTSNYKDSILKVFKSMPLSFSYVSLDCKFKFHEEAQRQYNHILDIVNHRLESVYGFQLSEALIEPSFICPALGLSGRMDLLQSDYRKIVEQKSGKWDEFHHTHRENHYVQMMLYRAILDYNIGISDIQSYLYYSRYSEGLLQETTYRTLLYDAYQLRNRIVAQEIACAQGGISSILSNLSPNDLVSKPVGKLWTGYQRPQIQQLLSPFVLIQSEEQRQDQAYFYRFYTFLSREQLQEKMAVPGNAGRAYSDLWNMPVASRRNLGSLIAPLHVSELFEESSGGGVCSVRFTLKEEESEHSSNFRLGDAVLLYRYENNEPWVHHQFLMRGTLTDVVANSVTVSLRNPQRNHQVFAGGEACFAIEHDQIEAASGRLYSGLYAFLTGDTFRRDLLLARRPPRVKTDVPPLCGDYGALNDLVERERRSSDFFFVIGPPGSGKTSIAIRSMLEEELRASERPVLLLAYTNRAVDELCAMLSSMSQDMPNVLPDYLRIGAEWSTDKLYADHLLSVRVEKMKSVLEVRTMVERTRVFLATLTTMSAQTELLKHICFGCAIIDEASQILEPQMLSLLFAQSEHGLAIERFVMVGDQKQLPAVVLQPYEASVIHEPELNRAGLTDCRRSLFERLLALQQQAKRFDLYFLLEKQGRMHPELFGFINQRFYQKRLTCVPLPHQLKKLSEFYPHAPQTDSLESILATHRLVFLNCSPINEGVNDKVNRAEAQLVAECLYRFRKLYYNEGRELLSDDVGIIVPYRNQISTIRREIECRGLTSLTNVCIDTVERFQGSQRNIVFFAFTVRHIFQLSFLSASTYMESNDADTAYPVDRKLNVALTRARRQIVLIGSAPLLSHNWLYHSLIESLKSSHSYFDADGKW